MKLFSKMQLRSSLLTTLWIAAFTFLGSAQAFAQNGSITGQITDSSAAIIPAATVDVVNTATGVVRTDHANGQGYFTISALPQGDYFVSASAQGFSKLQRTGVRLDQGQNLRVDLSLATGAVETRVEVNSQAPALERETSALTTTIEKEAVVALPLNGRNIANLVNLSPAVRGIGAFGAYTQSANTDGRIAIAGGEPSFNSFLVDGIANELHTSGGPMTSLSPDATEEIRIISRDAPAEFGRTGGGVINYVSKSGGNNFHGSAFTYAQNDTFDANDYFTKNAGKPIPPLTFYQYGATVGGPILRKNLFFFFNWEGSKQTIGSTSIMTVPTVLQRKGDFSQTLNAAGAVIPIYNPYTAATQTPRTQFTGNVIPTASLNPVALAVLSYYPLPNAPGNAVTGLNNYVASGVQTTDRNALGLRIDEYITQTQQLGVRYTSDRSTLLSPLYFGGNNLADSGFGPTKYPRDSASILYTNALTLNFLLELRTGFNRFGVDRDPISLGFDTTKLGFPASLNQQMQLQEFPRFAFSTTSPIGSNQGDPATQRNNAYSLGGSVTWVRGAHTLKAGAEGRAYQWNALQGTGVLQFNFDANFTKGPSPNAAATNGYDFASFLLGDAASATLYRHQNYAYTTKYGAGYLQDDWKITPRLVANYGLRYEHEGATTDRHNGISNFDPNLSYSAGAVPLVGGLKFVGANGVPRGDRDTTFDNFGPRVGLSYSAAPNTVVHAAFGLFFLPTTGGFNLLGATGFTSQTAYVPSVDGNIPTGSISTPFPQGIVLPSGSSLGPLTGLGTSINGNLRSLVSGTSEQWSANVQQRMGNFTLEIGYLGNHGLHLPADYAYHHLPQADLAQGTALQQLVVNPYASIITNGSLSAATVQQGQLLMNYPQFTGVTSLTNWAGSNYHALTVQVQRNLVKGLSLNASYTFSKLLDNNLGNGENVYADSGSNVVQNWDNLKAEKAVSTSNQPQRLTVAPVYRLPFGENGKRLYRSLAGGWQASGLLTAESGNVISVTANAPAYGGSRPNIIGNPTLSHPTVTTWLNKAAFQTIPAFTYGNSPRNLPFTRTQAYVNLDTSLTKEFIFHDRYRGQLAIQAFNTFNSTTFGSPDSNINDNNFGQITTLRTGTAARVLQFGFKGYF